jgi:hypothetical protein
VLADGHHVAIAQRMAPHTFALHHDAVGAVEVFDDRDAIAAGHDLAVVTADELAVDLQIVVGRTAR